MKKIIIPIIAVLFCACNAGSNTEANSSDSSGMKTNTDSIKADASHAAMNMKTLDSLPAIPYEAKVSFANLKDGQTVSSPLKVDMVAKNISVDSAGKIRPASGHFHILIDAEDSIPAGIVVPKDSTHLHFGNAQKQAVLALKPGKHTLALQFADGIHRSYGSKLSQAITVNVK